ncbi:MAG TPA: hypothetical protein VLW86_04640, partial [Syntrophorhabdales bacterium]|nr:hypothetical protein [Syntrophorhabdales bacterium]
ARVSLDLIDNTVHGREGVQRLIFSSGGTIPDRGYYDLRIEESHAKIGELDEEFVWERSVGDTFTLGPHVWQIRRITHNDVEVIPTEAKPGIIPFWKAEDMSRSFHFSERILLFLENINDRLADESLGDALMHDYFLDRGAVEGLIAFLGRQREVTKSDLPHRRHLLIEHFQDPLNTSDTKQVIIHTLWGGRVNRPFGLALQAAWEEKYSYHLEIIENNDCLLLMLPHEFSSEAIFSLVTPENLERLLRLTLEKSAFFGARFRENAGRALLLPRASFKRRLPLWLNRLRSKKLMDAVLQYPDFPILLETWRTCLQDEFDLESLRQLLDEVRTGRIQVTEAVTGEASPFAEGLVWKQTNQYMYEDDSPLSGKASSLSGELLKEVLFSHSLRPRIPKQLVADLEGKLQRTATGYAPRAADDLLDWVKERSLIPGPEWDNLLAAVERDHGLSKEEAAARIGEKILSLRLPGASLRLFAPLEQIDRVARAFSVSPGELDPRDPWTDTPLKIEALRRAREGEDMAGLEQNEATRADIVQQWLSFYGPARRSFLREVLGLDEASLDDLLAGLAETESIILDPLTESAGEAEICDRENLEILLRMARNARRPSFKALPIDHLPLFLASWQGLVPSGDSPDDLQDCLDRLLGFPVPVEAWEKQILPARMSPYYGSWLDSLFSGAGLAWFGCGKKKVSLAFSDDLELFLGRGSSPTSGRGEEEAPPDALARLFPTRIGRYTLSDIVKFSKWDSRIVTRKLWDLVWQGLVANDTFAALRQAVLADFTATDRRSERRALRSGAGRWGTAQPHPGNWHILDLGGLDKDPIDEAELIKDRARQLFRRYGVLFRELLANELPLLQWSAVFRALRLMELSGECLTGHFFEGIPGVQFCSHEAFRFLNEPLAEERVFWTWAADPASLCGIRLDSLKGRLPSRIPTTHVVYRGGKPVLISRRNGGLLDFRVPPDDPLVPDYLSVFKVLLAREFSPEKIVFVETINGKPALESDYAGALREFGFSRGYKGLELVKKYS